MKQRLTEEQWAALLFELESAITIDAEARKVAANVCMVLGLQRPENHDSIDARRDPRIIGEG
jgi:hypothetical protein